MTGQFWSVASCAWQQAEFLKSYEQRTFDERK
jgi:hypothetical protein